MPLKDAPKTKTISFRVPVALAERMEAVRVLAQQHGKVVDYTATVVVALQRDVEASSKLLADLSPNTAGKE